MEDFRKLEFGLGLLVGRDGYLLEKDVAERAITHKLAEYLQKLFPEWNVDCEFNRNLDQPKTIDINPRELLHLMAKRLEEDYVKNKSKLDKISTFEEINDLMKQLYEAHTEYMQEFDMYVFLLKLGDSIQRVPIYPDIIIHHRGTRDNHIVIEAKKTNNLHAEARLYDLVKLATLVSRREFRYKKGIFIDIPVRDDFSRFHSFKRTDSVFEGVFQYLPL